MAASSPSDRRWWGVAWRLLPLAVVVLFAFTAFWVAGDKGISLESPIRHRAIIDDFVSQHRVAPVAAFVIMYIYGSLTPQLIAALVGLGLLTLGPLVVKRWRAHAHAVT
ncbi:MAG TPA: hypothetical protein VFL53_09925 [Pseudolabrys sp.]|nr:hypothetical protein [Pseudolabrys sp.]